MTPSLTYLSWHPGPSPSRERMRPQSTAGGRKQRYPGYICDCKRKYRDEKTKYVSEGAEGTSANQGTRKEGREDWNEAFLTLPLPSNISPFSGRVGKTQFRRVGGLPSELSPERGTRTSPTCGRGSCPCSVHLSGHGPLSPELPTPVVVPHRPFFRSPPSFTPV